MVADVGEVAAAGARVVAGAWVGVVLCHGLMLAGCQRLGIVHMLTVELLPSGDWCSRVSRPQFGQLHLGSDIRLRSVSSSSRSSGGMQPVNELPERRMVRRFRNSVNH